MTHTPVPLAPMPSSWIDNSPGTARRRHFSANQESRRAPSGRASRTCSNNTIMEGLCSNPHLLPITTLLGHFLCSRAGVVSSTLVRGSKLNALAAKSKFINQLITARV
ncbi:hypothetical protein AG1IA_00829 [Rhizoctonia solani AG-1 IA]|uniref:Uncharacterized protein n=1 Tax=Thanatephorus cucumeris (strain AG1-IA) TaxID=983506 RepID=L8X7R2_THACA|nr:hypothetical protein AG1IA_00829 [Rhizoctonia solani AG-1 IA]